MQVQVINLESSHKRSGVHYELFVRLPPGLAQEDVYKRQATMIIPSHVTLIPNYKIVVDMKLINTYAALFLTCLLYTSRCV